MSSKRRQISSLADYIDFIKLGFGTSVISKNVKEKVKLYQKNNIKVYVGGTLFEAFIIRDKFEDYIKFVNEMGLDSAEVSDGSITIDHEKKCEYINKLAKNYTVLSEVGSKEEGVIIHPARWIKMMQNELDAGSTKVIAEARESGTVGIFHKNGSAHTLLINRIVNKIKLENIIWETPQKSQQVYFLKLFGSNVNVGNIVIFTYNTKLMPKLETILNKITVNSILKIIARVLLAGNLLIMVILRNVYPLPSLNEHRIAERWIQHTYKQRGQNMHQFLPSYAWVYR